MSTQASPQSKTESTYMHSGKHDYESGEDACFSSAITEMNLKPSEIMHIRLLKNIQAYLPDVDFEDFETQYDHDIPARQFAAEYSQNCYQ